ncbi:MAG: hypothetical protein U5L05_15920 [Rubrivivax sp.]|nr:hypothetical protein [Rubrivivax sp.]
MSEIEVVLCNPVRTALGTYTGTLTNIPAPALGAVAVRETLNRSGLAGDQVQHLIMGNVIQAGVKMNPARRRCTTCMCGPWAPARPRSSRTWSCRKTAAATPS